MFKIRFLAVCVLSKRVSKAKVILCGVNRWEVGRFISRLNGREIYSSVCQRQHKRDHQFWQSVIHVSHCFALFRQNVRSCSPVLPTQSSLLLFTEAWSRQLCCCCQPESSSAWWHLAGWLCKGTDLWVVKDEQINILGILDRIRLSRACGHLHMALTYHISIVFVVHFNMLPTLASLPAHPFPSHPFSCILLSSTKTVNNWGATLKSQAEVFHAFLVHMDPEVLVLEGSHCPNSFFQSHRFCYYGLLNTLQICIIE